MKYKTLFVIIVLSFQLVYSQTEQIIKGSVVNNDFAIQGIEVVNLNNKSVTITNNEGIFSILAKVGDQLMFMSKKYEYTTIILQEANFLNSIFVIHLIKKPEELEEVVVFKMPNIKLSKDKRYEQGKLDELTLEKAAQHPKPLGVYDGTLINSPDIMRIGGMILSLFVKQKETTKKKICNFKDLARSSYGDDFFRKTLQLKPEETALFLDFCDADPKSITVIENSNVLALLDFLFTKNVEFKKLQSIN